MQIQLSPCLYCVHYNKDTTCKAFPSGVPDKYMECEDTHYRPLPDGSDNGICFDVIPALREQYEDLLKAGKFEALDFDQ